ncbi:hypothetical protein PSLUR01_00224 [Escherichia phage vB_Eco_slurp01]|uniref:Uncharacterized protein n=1 Tax=Escherichia phage vB_Eco_slurp01 TaxID=1874688 RepID=A0A1C3S6H8_9CAUD|nr:hypothetical protein PSLUR01_00224 [Escherichia phage vB_Eco_slurp01]
MKTLSSTEYQTALFSLLNTLRTNNKLYNSREADIVNADVYLNKFIGTNYQELFTLRYISALRNEISDKTRQARREWNKQCDKD